MRSPVSPVIAAFLIIASSALAQVAETQPEVHEVAAGDSLARIAERAYGDGRGWTAIMLATNSRLSEVPKLQFIGDPNALEPGQNVWVPETSEKDRWMSSYRAYVAAVLDMSLPQPWEVSRRLVEIRKDVPTRVVTWARTGQFSLGTTTAGGAIWVTAVPHLRDFCRGLDDRNDLVPRLEQRLGMPPASNKTVFVEIELDQPAKTLFRPCADPRIDTNTCPLGPPSADVSTEYRDWFLNQYFVSYATAHPTRFPWTSLGYTYDWGSTTSEEGESEFIIRPEAQIEIVSITPTEEYCRP